MRLTPLDIRKQEFSRGFRGFEPEEVNAFLQMVANQWEELQDENRRKEEKIRELENKLTHYENVEEALQEALQTARESSRKALQHAEDKAEMIISKAESRADDIKREAEKERHDLKRETVKLSGRRSEIVTRLRAFLMSEMELLARYEGDDPVGFIRLLPAEEKRLRRLSERLEEEEAHPREARHEPEAEKQDAPWQEPVDRDDALRIDRGEAEKHYAEPQASQERSKKPAHEQARSRDVGPPAGEQEQDASRWPQFDQAQSAATPERDDPAQREEPSPREDHGDEGPGWTTRTMVSRPAEEASSKAGYDGGYDDDQVDEENDEAQAQRSSEEIEKIRRILSGLD